MARDALDPGGRWYSGEESTCQETQVRSLGREDALEEEMATHSSILAWRIAWPEEPGGLQAESRKESGMTERLRNGFNRDTLVVMTGEGCYWRRGSRDQGCC